MQLGIKRNRKAHETEDGSGLKFASALVLIPMPRYRGMNGTIVDHFPQNTIYAPVEGKTIDVHEARRWDSFI